MKKQLLRLVSILIFSLSFSLISSAQTGLVNQGTDSLMFFTNGNKSMIIAPNGKVRLGDIKSTAAASALLQLNSTTGGLLIPRMTGVQRAAMTNPVEGLLIYNTTAGKFNFYTGSAWTTVLSANGDYPSLIEDGDNDTKIDVETNTDEDKIRFTTGATERMIITENGDIGIGTSSPTLGLHMASNLLNGFVNQVSSGPGVAPYFFLAKSAGSVGSETAIGNSERLGGIGFNGHDGTDFEDGALIFARSAEVFQTGEHGTDLILSTVPIDGSSLEERLVVTSEGNVGIGTSGPESLLHIVGGSDATLTGGGQLILGDDNGENIIMDSNEIMARFNGAKSPLYFNPDGSDVIIHHAMAEATKFVVKDDGKVGIGISTPTAKAHVSGDLLLQNGTAVDEFSTDGTLAGNSDLAVPTEKAVKTYVDAQAGAAGWELTGNSSTVDGTNFIGNTDDIPLTFRVNNTQSARLESDNFNGNTFFGYNIGTSVSTGGYNTANGLQALSSVTSGNENAAFGAEALYTNTTGSSNSVSGNYGLYKNTTGSYNTAGGRSALYSNITGSSNIALGRDALYNNQAGSNGTAVGTGAMYYNNNSTTPFTNYNVAMGYEALKGAAPASGNTGNYVTAIGYQSLFSNKLGNNNTGLGYHALYGNTDGSDNTAVGFDALTTNSTAARSTAIGSNSFSSSNAGNNTGLGYNTGTSTTSGLSNTFIGYNAGNANTTGGFNTIVGSASGDVNQTGTESVFIGYNAEASADAFDNAIAIGANSVVGASNTMSLGGTGGNAVDVVIGGTTASATLDVEGDLILQNGVAIDEFSTDGTLAGNSDLAVPTEKAVKAYVDANGGSGTVTSVGTGTGLTGGPITTTGTLAVDVGTTASKIVQLNGSAQLPAVDGSLLTDIDATQLSTGAISNTEFDYLDGVTSFIQTQLDGKLSLAGGTMTGGINLGGNIITNASFVHLNTQAVLQWGLFSSAQETSFISGLGAGDLGKTWYNTDDNTVRYWNGSAVDIIGTGGVSGAQNGIGINSGDVELGGSIYKNTLLNLSGGNLELGLSGTHDFEITDGSTATHMIVTDAGNVGIGTSTPNADVHVVGDVLLGNNAAGDEGVLTVLLTNNTGSASVKGDIIVMDPTTNNAFVKTTSSGDARVLGVVYEAGIANGAACKVAIAGIVDVIADMATTRGQHCITGSTTAGRAESVAMPAAGTSIGVWLENTSVGSQGKVLLR